MLCDFYSLLDGSLFGIDLYPINFADQSSFHIYIAFILSSGQMFNFFEYLWNAC